MCIASPFLIARCIFLLLAYNFIVTASKIFHGLLNIFRAAQKISHALLNISQAARKISHDPVEIVNQDRECPDPM